MQASKQILASVRAALRQRGMTYRQLADALGLSAVHVNRVLRQLREDGLATFRDGHVTIHDHKALAELADFDEAYLDHSGPLLK